MPRKTYVTAGHNQSFGLRAPIGSSFSWGILPDSRQAKMDAPATSAAVTDRLPVRPASFDLRPYNHSTTRLVTVPTVAVPATHQMGNTDGNCGNCGTTRSAVQATESHVWPACLRGGGKGL